MTQEQPRRGVLAKTIKSILRNKHRAWVNSIEDTNVQNLVQQNSICTGGAIASMLLGEKVNDFDFYFTNKETAVAVANYYVDRFKAKKKFDGIKISVLDDHDRVKIVVKSAGVSAIEKDDGYKYFEGVADQSEAGEYLDELTENASIAAAAPSEEAKTPFRPVFLSSNAITISDGVQIVLRFYGNPDQIHENYDFVHCTNYWLSETGHLELRPTALQSLLARELRYVGSKYPICSLVRLRKFIGRGWRINAGQIFKIAHQISSLDLEDVIVLEDQLTGVDVAYFHEVIRLLTKKQEETGFKEVDATYLMELIDRVF